MKERKRTKRTGARGDTTIDRTGTDDIVTLDQDRDPDPGDDIDEARVHDLTVESAEEATSEKTGV